MLLLVRSSKLSRESQEEQPEHVIRGEECRDRSHEIDDAIERQRQIRGTERGDENLILGEKSGKGREAGNRARRDEKRPRSDRNLLPQPAHVRMSCSPLIA